MNRMLFASVVALAVGLVVSTSCDGGYCEERDSSSLIQTRHVAQVTPSPQFLPSNPPSQYPTSPVLDLTGTYHRRNGQVRHIEQEGSHGKIVEIETEYTIDRDGNVNPTSGHLFEIGVTGKANSANGRIDWSNGDYYTVFKCYSAHLAETKGVEPAISTNSTASAIIQVSVDSIKITNMKWEVFEWSRTNPIIGIHIHQGDFDLAISPLRVGFCGQHPLPSFSGACEQAKDVCNFHEGGDANLARFNITIPEYAAMIIGSGESVGEDWSLRLHTQSSFDVRPGIGLIRGRLEEVECVVPEVAPVLDLTGTYHRLFADDVVHIEQEGSNGKISPINSDYTIDEHGKLNSFSGGLSDIPGLTGMASVNSGVHRVLFNVGDVYTQIKCFSADLAETKGVEPAISTNSTASATIQVSPDSIKITSMKWEVYEWSLENPIIGIHIHQGDFDLAISPLRVGFCGQHPLPPFSGACEQGIDVLDFHEVGDANLGRFNMTVPEYAAMIFASGESVGENWSLRLHTQSSFDVEPGIGLIRGRLQEVKCGAPPAPVLDLTGTYHRLFADGEVIHIEQEGSNGRIVEAKSNYTIDDNDKLLITSGELSEIPDLTGEASNTNGVRRVLFDVGDVYTEFKCFSAHLAETKGVEPAISTNSTASAVIQVSVDSIKITSMKWEVFEWSVENPIIGIHIHQGDFDLAISPLRVGFCGQHPLPSFSGACEQGKEVCNFHEGGDANLARFNSTIPEYAAMIFGIGKHVGEDWSLRLHTQSSFDVKPGIGLIRGRLQEVRC